MADVYLAPFRGAKYHRSHVDYPTKREQYSTFGQAESRMTASPEWILYPCDDDDVKLAVRYAKDNNIAIAVRTGGHQYSGASSTNGKNIQLDLSSTYKDFNYNNESGLLRVGISHSLEKFNTKLGDLKLFLPHGQCGTVHLGGHVQTGGYGQLGRGFGLFADHVLQVELIAADGAKQIVTATSDPELFFALLGGSPGNFGVITHLTLKPLKDQDHPNSRGLKVFYWYSKKRLERLLKVLVQMAEDENLEADFDFCLTMLSETGNRVLKSFFPTLKKSEVRLPKRFAKAYRNEAEQAPDYWPPSIIVYLQWANLRGGEQMFDSYWFDRIKEAGGNHPQVVPGCIDASQYTPMSQLTTAWLFHLPREFPLPYEKRTYLTNSRTLSEDGWVQWVAGRIDEVETRLSNHCKLSVQIQNFGGVNSRFRRNADNGTGFSWRKDTSVVCVLDCFYDKDGKGWASRWQQQNDQEGIGSNGKFCKEDRRVHWASYGDTDMNLVWRHYYDSSQKYTRLQEVKQRIDPTGVFTPNPFSVPPKRPDPYPFHFLQSVGMVNAFAGTPDRVPHGWLPCDGREVSVQLYPQLFNAIGRAYGTASNPEYFLLPDLRGRVIVGVEGSNARRIDPNLLNSQTVGAVGGRDKETLTIDHLPPHNHTGFTGTEDTLQVYYDLPGPVFAQLTQQGRGNYFNTRALQPNIPNLQHRHSIPAEGGGNSHPNIQPSIILSYIIKSDND